MHTPTHTPTHTHTHTHTHKHTHTHTHTHRKPHVGLKLSSVQTIVRARLIHIRMH